MHPIQTLTLITANICTWHLCQASPVQSATRPSTVASTPVQLGDELLIDLFDYEKLSAITVRWEQYGPRQATYYYIDAYNLKTAETVPFFIATEYYGEGTATYYHIKKISEVIPGSYKFKVSDLFEYGEKNDNTKMRFLVFHDRVRRPFQHYFIESAFQSALNRLGEDAANQVLDTFSIPAINSADAIKINPWTGRFLQSIQR